MAGPVVGLLRLVARRSRAGAIVVGVAAALPVSVGLTALVEDRAVGRFESSEWITVAVSALLFGLYGGGMLWKHSAPPNSPRREV